MTTPLFDRQLTRAIWLLLLCWPAVGWPSFDSGVAEHQNGDYAAAFREFEVPAPQGNVLTQFNLGLMYRKGLSVSKDYAEAVRLFREAGKQGEPDAQVILGFIYGVGLGVQQDYAEAAKWYKRAAEQGLALGQLTLALLYAKGQGVVQDDVRAYAWFDVAAALGDRVAIQSRDSVAERMTPSELIEGKRLGEELLEKYPPMPNSALAK